jgi:ABC-type lipoprotein export system ATPase subunit
MAEIGFVFQDGRLLPYLSLGENISLPLVFARMDRT